MNRPAPRLLSLLVLTLGLLTAPTLLLAQANRTQSAGSQTPNTETWKWNDLVNRPERWAPEVKLKESLEFQDGSSVPAGAILRVTRVMPRQVEALLPDGAGVALEPNHTDLLEASNRYWQSLTPEQRAVDLAAISKDRTLLPPFVTTYGQLDFPKDVKKPGDEVIAADVVKQALHVWSMADAQAIAIPPTQTDLLVRARALAALPLEQRQKAPWLTDYAAALEKAKEENRNVFLFFTGSDWCGWCMRLEREILRMPEFADFAAENLVLVKLDFPRGFRLPAAQTKQNQQLAQQYGVRGYPTVVVLKPDGTVAGDLGYETGGPKPFIEKLQSL